MFSPANFTSDIKASWIDPKDFISPSHIFKARISKVDMKNQKGSSDVKNLPSVKKLSITEKEDLTNMKDVIIIKSAGQQNRNIPNCNKHLKTITLNILKYLSKDILREEPDFSAIKSSGVNHLR